GENNRDGESNNLSSNSGIEGPTTDPAVLELRKRQRRNLLVTLLLSQGVPMLSGGDELGGSQAGNTSAYCHDRVLTGTPGTAPDADSDFLEFVQRLVSVRTTSAVLRRRTFLAGSRPGGADVRWLRADGTDLVDADWADESSLSLGMLLDGTYIREVD